MKIRKAKMRWSLPLFVGMMAAWEKAAAQRELGGEGWGYKFKPVMGRKYAQARQHSCEEAHPSLRRGYARRSNSGNS